MYAEKTMDLDRVDRRILSILQADGRIAAVDLADQVGLSPASTGERLKRLQKYGYIDGFGARLNPERIGLGMLIFIEVSLHRTSPDVFDRFADAVRKAPQVLECHMVAGGFDYLIKTRVGSMAAYRKFLGEILLSLPGVRETRTYAVMEEVKAHGLLPL